MIGKIKAEVDRLKVWVEENKLSTDFYDGAMGALLSLTAFIESLEKEQPQGLDEAAELEPAIDEYLRVVKETSLRQIARYFAQWGAKWMAGQGFTMGATFRISDDENPFVNFEDHKGSKEQSMKLFKDGDKVIVQIRNAK